MRPAPAGILAALALLGAFGAIVSLLSGVVAMLDQFSRYWYFLLPLALGFGLQVGLSLHLRRTAHRGHAGMVAATGGTSTAAMLSCCTHYLATTLPLLGTSGLAALVGRYQPQVFLLGIAANAIGIGFLVRRIQRLRFVPSPSLPTQP